MTYDVCIEIQRMPQASQLICTLFPYTTLFRSGLKLAAIIKSALENNLKCIEMQLLLLSSNIIDQPRQA